MSIIPVCQIGHVANLLTSILACDDCWTFAVIHRCQKCDLTILMLFARLAQHLVVVRGGLSYDPLVVRPTSARTSFSRYSLGFLVLFRGVFRHFNVDNTLKSLECVFQSQQVLDSVIF